MRAAYRLTVAAAVHAWPTLLADYNLLAGRLWISGAGRDGCRAGAGVLRWAQFRAGHGNFLTGI